METCNVFNVERYATEDGPGIRTVVFLKGCNLGCKWCSNPESQKKSPQILHKPNSCINCGKCLAICPVGAISYKSGFGFVTDENSCIFCKKCVNECYYDARQVMGTPMNEEELFHEILKDEQYFKMSGGGLTFSGGEPLMYSKSIKQIAIWMKERGYSTLVETCGQIGLHHIKEVYQYVDYIYYDFKHIDFEIHKKLTGCDNSLICSNLLWLCDHYKGELSVRYPYIPGCNDDPEAVGEFFRYISGLKHIKEIVFLPYHRLGIGKYQGLGREYPMGNMKSLKKPELDFLKDIAARYGLDIKIQ